MFNIFSILNYLGLTKAELAILLGVDQRSISRWVNEESVPDSLRLGILLVLMQCRDKELRVKESLYLNGPLHTIYHILDAKFNEYD